MPGLITHLLAGCSMYVLGLVVFKDYFSDELWVKKNILLAASCIGFSLIVDVFLGFYYVTGLLSYEILEPYHRIMHLLIGPNLVLILLFVIVFFAKKYRPILIMGFFSLILHLVMDLFIQETGALF